MRQAPHLAGPARASTREEIEAPAALHLGNFPQAFTHLALINAVAHVIADEQAGERTGASAVFRAAIAGAGWGPRP